MNAQVANKQIAITEHGVKWAMQHDWFVKANTLESGPLLGCFAVTVKEILQHENEGEYQEEITVFTCVNELRAWAGY